MQILTANRLVDGDVVFLTGDYDWSIEINDASIARDQEEACRLEDIGTKADKSAHVVGCYLVDVVITEGRIEATHYREIMRTKGPTVRGDLGKQANVYGSGGLRSGQSPLAAQNHHEVQQEFAHVSL